MTANGQPASPPRMDLPHQSVRLRARGIISGQKNSHELETTQTHDLLESRVVS